MTQLLERALERVRELPDQEQNAIAEVILDELQWQEAFASSQDQLAKLAKEALDEFRAGKTLELDPDTL